MRSLESGLNGKSGFLRARGFYRFLVDWLFAALRYRIAAKL
jgi:hypothetical protein